jgi:hypothetical protein
MVPYVNMDHSDEEICTLLVPILRYKEHPGMTLCHRIFWCTVSRCQIQSWIILFFHYFPQKAKNYTVCFMDLGYCSNMLQTNIP